MLVVQSETLDNLMQPVVSMQEYEPTIYLPKRSTQSLHQDFTVQCEKMDIPFLSYLPTEVSISQ